MALELKDSFVAGSLGTTTIFKDITGVTAPNSYGKSGNITYSDVDAVRIKVATLSSIANVTELSAGSSFTRYVEYICTAGSGTIDGKAISSGDYFVPNTTGLTVPSGMTFETSGYYVYPYLATWLPTAAEVGLTSTLAQLNQANNTTLEDSVYTLVYEVYKDVFSTTTAAVSGVQYMVLTGTCTYGGNTYRAGEVFISTNTNNITISSGSVVKMDATTLTYFTITYNMLKQLYALLPIVDEQIQQEIYGITVQLDALSFSCQTGNVSYTYAQGLLNTLQDKVTYLVNNY